MRQRRFRCHLFSQVRRPGRRRLNVSAPLQRPKIWQMRLIGERIPDAGQIENEARHRAFALQLVQVCARFDFAIGAVDFDSLVFRIDEPA